MLVQECFNTGSIQLPPASAVSIIKMGTSSPKSMKENFGISVDCQGIVILNDEDLKAFEQEHSNEVVAGGAEWGTNSGDTCTGNNVFCTNTNRCGASANYFYCSNTGMC